MKRQYIFLAAVVLMLASAGGASALEWSVTATVSVRIIPIQGGNENKAISTGFHRLLLTEITAADLFFPVRFRITAGTLEKDGASVDGCSTGWIWGWNATTATCVTNETEEECSSAYWEALTSGQVQLHPAGGLKQNASGPVFGDCTCT